MSVHGGAWPIEHAGAMLAHVGGERATSELVPPPAALDPSAFGSWLASAASAYRLEAVPVRCAAEDHWALVRTGAPFIAPVGWGPCAGLVLCIRGGRRKTTIVTPDGSMQVVSTTELVSAIRAAHEQRQACLEPEQFDCLARLPLRRRLRFQESIATYSEDSDSVDLWLLRPTVEQSLVRRLRGEGLVGAFSKIVATQVALVLVTIAGWWVVGRVAFAGTIQPGWVQAWVLLLLLQVPLRAGLVWQQAAVGIAVGRVVKQHLIHRLFALDTGYVRTFGIGGLLGKVVDTEQVERLAIGGGFAALVTAVDLAGAAFVFSKATAAGPLMLALAVFCVVLGWCSWIYLRRAVQWTSARLHLTNGLVERMVGHRTRAVQEPPQQRHRVEDGEISAYAKASQRFDRWQVLIGDGLARLWSVVGITALVPAFLSGAFVHELAIGVAGVLLARRSIGRLSEGVVLLGLGRASFLQVSELYRAEHGVEPAPARCGVRGRARDGATLQLRNVTLCYPNAGAPALRDCNLDIHPGDRIVVRGKSGSGKTTLAAVIGGLRAPDRGLVLLDGLDMQTVGSTQWRARVAVVPQFYENHIVSGTMAFNLLMGSAWPPTAHARCRARAVCEDLGLGPLLDKMPSGLNQRIGNAGWRLSHGEQSRVFLARALLQGADLLAIDESLGALDPRTREQCLEAVERHASAVLLVAHP